MSYDIEADELPLGGNALAAISKLAEDQWAAEKEVERLQEELEEAGRALRKISEIDLPNMLEELGLSEFKTDSGLVVTVKESIKAGISKDRMAAGIKWLEDNSLGKLVKYGMKITIPKGDTETSEKIYEATKNLVGEDQISSEATVHPQSLGAAVRELLEKGVDVPMDLLGVHRARASKVKVPKGKQAK